MAAHDPEPPIRSFKNGPEAWDFTLASPPLPKDLEQERAALFETGSSFKPVYRDEIAGIDNVLGEIEDVIHYLRRSREYNNYGARIEPGILFEGRPGTGKTMVARWMATEAQALFIDCRNWPLAEITPTAQDIAALFRHARETFERTGKPIILFYDEFESLGRAREEHGITSRQVQLTNQISTELQGVNGQAEGILLVGCTNYINSVDPALQRSGRMGLHIEFTAPDREGKRKLLELYLKNYDIDPAIDLHNLSYFFDSQAVAADIEEACAEAWRYAVRRHLKDVNSSTPCLSHQDLVEVFVKRLVGPPSMFINLPWEDRLRIAVHESGHALAALAYDIPLRLITVQPGKNRLGCVITADVREHLGSVDEFISAIRISFGSVCAEESAGLPASVGATSDLHKANDLALTLIEQLNQGDHLGPLVPKAIGRARATHGEAITPSVSQETIERADKDLNRLLRRSRIESLKLMEAIGKNRLLEVAERVANEVTMTGDEFRAIVEDIAGDVRRFV